MELPYTVRRIRFANEDRVIILHGADHKPHSPLLALCNVLSLRDQLGLSLDATQVFKNELINLLTIRLSAVIPRFSHVNKNYVNENEEREKFEQKVKNSIMLLPTLDQCHPDIRFRWSHDFKDFPERNIFRLLRVPLYHGRLVSSKESIYDEVGDKTLSELRTENSRVLELMTNTRFTSHGIFQLYGLLETDDRSTDTLCTFVFNDEFIVMAKMDNVLMTLTASMDMEEARLWCAPLGAYSSKRLVDTRGNKVLKVAVLVIGDSEFLESVVRVFTAFKEDYEEFDFYHYDVLEDAWRIVASVDLHMIVTHHEIFTELQERRCRELEFRGMICEGPVNHSTSQSLRSALNTAIYTHLCLWNQ